MQKYRIDYHMALFAQSGYVLMRDRISFYKAFVSRIADFEVCAAFPNDEHDVIELLGESTHC